MNIVSENLLTLAAQQKEKARTAFDDGREGDARYHLQQAIKYIDALVDLRNPKEVGPQC